MTCSMGPMPLYHQTRMLQTLIVLMRSTKPGGKNQMVQFSTAWNILSTLTVLWESLPSYGTDNILSIVSRKAHYVVTLSSSTSWWYKQFILGVCACMQVMCCPRTRHTILRCCNRDTKWMSSDGKNQKSKNKHFISTTYSGQSGLFSI